MEIHADPNGGSTVIIENCRIEMGPGEGIEVRLSDFTDESRIVGNVFETKADEGD